MRSPATRAAAAAGVAAAVGALWLASDAGAAEFEVLATSSNTFTPKTLEIAVDDTVAWRNAGGFHNVVFDDGSYEMPSDPLATAWRVSRAFSTAGSFRYYCEAHGDRGGEGMSGTIVVEAGAAPPPDTQAPTITQLRLRASRSRTLTATLAVSEVGRATLALARRSGGRYRAVRTIRRQVRAGSSRHKLVRDRSGRRLPAGRYRISVRVRDAAGNLSKRRRAHAALR